jgi:calpain-15
MYGAWFFIDGIWQSIVIDDLFPTYNGKPIYSRNHNNEIWVMLLEKAYAKVY